MTTTLTRKDAQERRQDNRRKECFTELHLMYYELATSKGIKPEQARTDATNYIKGLCSTFHYNEDNFDFAELENKCK